MSAATDDRAASWRRPWEPATPIGPVRRDGTGPWDEHTRGFWSGGQRIDASELRPGDVYREGTLSGWEVLEVTRGHYGNAVTILVTVVGWDAPRVLSPGQSLEILERAPRYVCKACGAESPTGIGYAATTVGPMPAPAADCLNPHA
jgi:hypothetical protein